MRSYLAAILFISASSALAEEVKQQPQIDPNTQITITVGELQALLQAEHDKIATEAVAAKIQAQIKAKK